jgi:hypothetical protein
MSSKARKEYPSYQKAAKAAAASTQDDFWEEVDRLLDEKKGTPKVQPRHPNRKH